MNSIAQYARAYAEALDRLERFRSWMKAMDKWSQTRQSVHVTWHDGSSMPGYHDVAAEVSRLTSERMPDLLKHALSNAEIDVRKADQQLQDAMYLGAKGHLRAGDAS